MLVVPFSKAHSYTHVIMLLKVQGLNFSTQHIVLIPRRFLRHRALGIALRNKSWMFLVSFGLLAQEAFLPIEKIQSRLAELVQGTNSQKINLNCY